VFDRAEDVGELKAQEFHLLALGALEDLALCFACGRRLLRHRRDSTVTVGGLSGARSSGALETESGRRRADVLQARNVVLDETAMIEVEPQSADVRGSNLQDGVRLRPPILEARLVHLHESRFISLRLRRRNLLINEDGICA